MPKKTVIELSSLKQRLYLSPNPVFGFKVKHIIGDVFYYFCGLLPLSDSFDRVTGNMRTETEGEDDM